MVETMETRCLLSGVLGTAADFAVLGASTVTSTGATSIISNVGVSPGTAITGFPPGNISGGTIHANDALAAQAHADLATAYGVISGEASSPANNLSGQDLGGMTLLPGVYHFNTSAQLTGILTLDAQGDPNARFDFQIGTTLITAGNSAVRIINDGQTDDVFFQVGTSATLGTGTAFEGNILADQSITLTDGATILEGRALAIGGAVTLDTNQISAAEADVSITNTAPGSVIAGNTLTYSLTAANAGPNDAQTVSNSDVVPANTTFVSATQTSGPAFTLTNPAVGATGTIAGTIGTLIAGASANFNVVVMVSPSIASGTSIGNTANVASATSDPNSTNNGQTVVTTVQTQADVSITNTTSGSVIAGNTLTYTLTASNSGPSDAQTVALSDLIPTNTVFVSAAQTSGPAFALTSPAAGGTGTIAGTIGTLAAGASASFTVVVFVSPSAASGATITDTADVTSATNDLNLTNNSQTASTSVGTQSDVSITNTAAGSVIAGNTLTYTITAANSGPSDAQTLALSDTIPANATFVSAAQTSGPAFTLTSPSVGGTGTIAGTISTLASGASASFDVVVMVSPSAASGATISDTANVTSATNDLDLTNNSQTVSTSVSTQSDVSITNTAAGSVIAGNTLSYTITAGNSGPSDAQTVALSDLVPANTTFVAAAQISGPAFSLTSPAAGGTGTIAGTIGTLAAGASASFTVVVLASPSAANGATISDTADVTTATNDPNLANNNQTVVTTVNTEADVSITNTSAGSVIAGNTLTYTITAANSGPSDAQTLAFSDLVPANTTFVSAAQTSGPAFTLTNPTVGGTGTIAGTISTLASGASASFNVVVLVSPSAASGASITDTANITTATTDPNPANNSQTASTGVGTQADVSITNTAAGSVIAGNTLTYTITAANSGPSDAQTVALSDLVPADTTFVSAAQISGPAFTLTSPSVGGTGTIAGTIGTLASGASASFTVVVLASPNAASGATISDTANVTSATNDLDLTNNSQTASTSVGTQADVSITNTAAGSVIAGNTLSYTITAANAGPSDAQTVALSDLVPANTTFVSAAQISGPAFTLTSPSVGGTGTIAGTIGTLAAGASAGFNVVVMVSPSAVSGATITDTANITTATTDPNPANDSQTAATSVNTQSDVSITNTSAGSVIAGNTLTYTITAANSGPSDAQTLALSDLVPANTTFLSAAQTSGPAFTLTSPSVGGTGTIAGSISTLTAGASASFNVTVMVSPSAVSGATITDTANITTATTDPDTANNSQTASTSVATQSDVSVTNTTAGSVIAGNTLTYTITAANSGPSDAQTLALSDLVPANTTFVSATQTSGPAFTLTSPSVGGTGTIAGTISTLAAGASASFNVVVMVSPSTASGATISDTANITSATNDLNLANNSQTASTSVGTQSDVFITNTTAGSVIAGNTLSYTITVANAGPGDAQTVALSDSVPANTTFVSATQTSGPAFTLTSPSVGGTGTIAGTIGTLASGASASFVVVVRVSPSAVDGGTIANTATITVATDDPNLVNNSQAVLTNVQTQADVSITNTTSANSVIAGTNLTYTITVANAGPSDAQTVALSDIIPANTTFVSAAQTSGPAFTLTSPAAGGTGTISGTIATLAVGASASFTVVVRVSPSAGDGTSITSTADIASGTGDPNLANASQSISLGAPVAAPMVTALSPAQGTIAGGALITITGANLQNATAVRFGSTAVTSFISDSPGQIVVASPIGSAGTVDVTVVTSSGTSATSPSDIFSYLPVVTIGDAPAITSAGSATFTVGQFMSFTVSTTGLPIAVLTETGALPAGLTFADLHDGTASISGTPAAATDGAYGLALGASNGISPAASLAFSLTLLPAAANPPVITVNPYFRPISSTGNTGTLHVLAATTGTDAGLTYTWSILSQPTAAPALPLAVFSINGANSAKNTSVTFLASGQYTLQVVASDGIQSVSGQVQVTVHVERSVAHATTRATQVSGVQTLGDGQSITGFVVTFNAPVDPSTAQDVRGYGVLQESKSGKKIHILQSWFGTDPGNKTDTTAFAIATAVYNSEADAVTLTLAAPMPVKNGYRLVKVLGTGPHAVLDANGKPIDGDANGKAGGNFAYRFRMTVAKDITYQTTTGDTVKLSLSGPGEIVALLPIGTQTPIIDLVDTDPVGSILTGKIHKGRKSLGYVVLDQLTGTANADIQLGAEFHINQSAATATA